MIEESFVRLYAHDFIRYAVRAELGQADNGATERRVAEARSHAAIMDRHKGSDHLAALTVRLRDEAKKFTGRSIAPGSDVKAAGERHRLFLNTVAKALTEAAAPAEAEARRARR